MLEIWLKGLQIVLGLGAFGALVLTGTTLFAGSADRHEPIPAIAAGQPKLSVSLPSYRVIADRNLFKVKEKAAEAPVEPPIAESKLQIQLLGTLVVQGADTGNSDPKGSLAIIRDTSGEVVTLAIGDEFAEKRARLARVEPRRIVLEQSGRLEAVLLDEESAAGAPPAPGMPLPARIGVPGIGVPGQAPAVTPSMAQDVARRMTQAMGPDAAMLAMFRQLQPHLIGSVERDANGRLSGYRIARITEGSPL